MRVLKTLFENEKDSLFFYCSGFCHTLKTVFVTKKLTVKKSKVIYVFLNGMKLVP